MEVLLVSLWLSASTSRPWFIPARRAAMPIISLARMMLSFCAVGGVEVGVGWFVGPGVVWAVGCMGASSAFNCSRMAFFMRSKVSSAFS